MIWLPLVLALLAEPVTHGSVVLRPTIRPARGGRWRGKWILRDRNLGPTAAPRAMSWADWEALAGLIVERGREMRGERAA